MAAACALLLTERVQQAVTQAAVRSLSARIGSEVSVGTARYRLPNTIALSDVYLEDLQGDTLLYAGRIDARFSLLRLLTGRVIVHSAALDRLQAALVVDAGGRSNLAFLLEAFARPQPAPRSRIDYHVHSLRLTDAAFRYTNHAAGRDSVHTPHRLDFNCLHLHDIDADLSLDVLTPDTLSATIRHLSATEQSGLRLDGLTTEIHASPSRLSAPRLEVRLPRSVLRLEDISLAADSGRLLARAADELHVSGRLAPSRLRLADLGSLVPELADMYATPTLEARLRGRLSDLRVQDIRVQYGESFLLHGNLHLNGLPHFDRTFVYADLRELKLNGADTERFLSDFTGTPVSLPEAAKQLGTVRYRGNISGFFSNLVMYGRMTTAVGSLSTDILLRFDNDFRDISYNGTLQSSGLNLGRLLTSDKVDSIAFYFNTKGSHKQNGPFQGVIDANVPKLSLLGYLYSDIRFNGAYDGNGFNGQLAVEDENVNLRFNGLIDLTQRLPVFDFDLSLKDTKLYKLGLIGGLPESTLSFKGKTGMTGNSMDNINGYIRFDSIRFRNADRVLNADSILFTSRTEGSHTDFRIRSRYLNGSLSGRFKYTELAPLAMQAVNSYLPSFQAEEVERNYLNHIDIDLSIANTQDLAALFGSPYSLGETATIKGTVDERRKAIDIVASLPRIQSGTQTFNNTTLHLWGLPEQLEFIVESDIPTPTDYWNVALYSTARHDTLQTRVEWRNRQRVANRGELLTLTDFRHTADRRLLARTAILPSDIVISDSLWRVSADTIAFDGRRVDINRFRFGNGRQYLSLDGTASHEKDDSLNIAMQDIDLGFISTMAGMKGFRLGGTCTGNASVMGALERPVFDAALSVDSLTLNHVHMGDASIFSTWDGINEQVVAIASINRGRDITALAECTYSPSHNALNVQLDANRLSLDFLNGYYDTILPHTTGYASGKLHIGGPLDAIRFDGRLMVNDGQVTVGVLGSTFHFNDTIAMTPTSIEFPRLTLYDAERNRVLLDGRLTHDGTFKDFRYDLDVVARDARVADLAPGDNELFFGRAYADASVRITGDEEEVVIRADALTKPGTKVFIQTGSSSTTTDAGFIHFVKHEEEDSGLLYATPPDSPRRHSNLRLHLQLEATPAAEIELIIDPVGGDMIAGKGAGNLRIEYDSNQADAKMYGSYTIESGKYQFNLQDIFRKEFKIESGSTVLWTGSPSDAQVDIRAVYSLTASLKTLLDDDMLATLSNNTRLTIPVNCVLLLTGNLMTPTIRFDIDLPSSDEGMKQIVNSVINTDELLTRQILYLLVFNQFYKANEPDATGGGGEFFSLAASTASAQLNNLIAQFTRNNKFSFGMDMRRVDEANMEVGFDVLYQPNDRWVVNGNFGYRSNNNNIEDYNQYITDVDIEYLLTASGKLSLKFYNHTIDRTAQLRTAKNTQGAGIVYKENFDGVIDMFRYYWRALLNIGKKKKQKDNDNTHEPTEENSPAD